MNRPVSLALAGLLASGCYWSSPPTNPHGNVALDPAKLPTLQASGHAARLASRRLVVFGRLDSVATQPIGGVYDHVEATVSPLNRTYFFRDGPLEIFEHTTDALRAAGLDVRKDYATTGAPQLLEPRLRARSPLLMGGQIRALQHDQIRTDAGDAEVARLVLSLWVREADGRVRYEREHTIEGKTPHPPPLDMLRLLGTLLVERLDQDADFRRALEVSP